MGTEIALEKLEKGDIVFIKDGDSFFGGIYTGDDTIVFSPYPGQKVRTASMKSVYYTDNFLKAVESPSFMKTISPFSSFSRAISVPISFCAVSPLGQSTPPQKKVMQ